MESKQLVLGNIQPSTIFISEDADKLVFGDVLHAKAQGQRKAHVPMMHPPYEQTFFQLHRFKDFAHTSKDQYSIGIVILEILAGTDIVTPAFCHDWVEEMLDDCCNHLDPFTQGLLQKLINLRGEFNIQMYIDNCSTGYKEVVTGDILRIEAALEDDLMLQTWKGRYSEFMAKLTRKAYDQYRLMPGDVQRNIDWDVIKTNQEMDADDIQL